MATYTAPLHELKFIYHEVLDGNSIQSLKGYEELSQDLVDAVLEEAGRFTTEVLFPLNLSGDAEGCAYENGIVRTPQGFKEAYEQFRNGGWTGIAANPDYGGQGLPKTISTMIEEMICSANLSFGMYPGLTHGAYNAIELHGTEEQKQTYLPKFADGSWSGTMCLTEPQCGTDLGLLRTKADHLDDGSYNLTGTKTFISAGEHDLTENIVHLVLARLPDAPPGVKGISLFVVPKFLPMPDGSPGPRNGVSCGSIEHKMGIKASATCVINFDAATGWLVGQPHKGMRAMFTMMNAARLGVGIQGLGLAEASYQGALSYAQERLQGRAISGTRHPDKPADPILVHPDVRRMLLTMKCLTEGLRAMMLWVAKNLDIAQKAQNEDERRKADDLVQLMTPVVKAFGTDIGFQLTNIGLQVYGGHGYIHENGMEQYVRDARITQLYEGTNGIQALDLVGRKMGSHYGRYLRSLFHPLQTFIEENAEISEMEEFVVPLAKAFGRLQQGTAAVAQKSLVNRDEAGAVATDLLKLFGYVTVAFMWARMTKIALAKQGDDPNGFYAAKIKTARFYMQRVLPITSSLFAMIMAGAKTTMDMSEELFSSSQAA